MTIEKLKDFLERAITKPKNSMHYRAKPVTINAIEWDNKPGTFAKIVKLGGVRRVSLLQDTRQLLISTLEGEMKADVGDFIIRGLIGEVYPCKPEVFNKKYEKI